jgi:hypothetical protein
MTRSFALYTGEKGMCSIDLALREEFAMYNARDYIKHLLDQKLIDDSEAASLFKMIASSDLENRTLAYELIKHQYDYQSY